MNSRDLARYIEASNSMSQPWLLVQLRLKKLQERKHTLPSDTYIREVAALQEELMNLGEWWRGREDEVF